MEFPEKSHSKKSPGVPAEGAVDTQAARNPLPLDAIAGAEEATDEITDWAIVELYVGSMIVVLVAVSKV